MQVIPLLDFECSHHEVNYEEEARILGLDYCFKHISIENDLSKYDSIVITDKAALNYLHLLEGKNLYFWLMEPAVINPYIYDLAIKHSYRFKKIFSHHKYLCKELKNAFWYPWGSYNIPLKEHQIYQKNKNTSIVCSSKKFTYGQQLRHASYEATKSLLDGFKYAGEYEDKSKWHKKYRFSINVENCYVDGYFTEKIIDCFRTGTIPIYKGDPEILNYFDKDGIILFETPEELQDIVKKCNEDLYESKINSVRCNYKKAEPFLYPWKFIKENYLNEIF